jgi:quercetin dioxygenase-like cupin family protein
MSATQPPPKRTDLRKTPVGDVSPDRLELAAYTTELPAGYEIQRHRHTYSTVGYVLEGKFRLEVGESGEKVFECGPGGVFTEPAGETVSGKALEATKLYIVLARQPGKPEAVLE